MKNQFKDMVDAGVASFHYDKNFPDLPVLDPLVRTYNNFWGLASNTHMTLTDDKRYIITGTIFNNTKDHMAEHLLWASWIRGIYIPHSGYCSFTDFLIRNKKDYKKINWNGQIALELFDRVELPASDRSANCPRTPDGTYTGFIDDSQIPKTLKSLEKKPGIINRIASTSDDTTTMCERLNESKQVHGEFYVLGPDVICKLNEKYYKLIWH